MELVAGRQFGLVFSGDGGGRGRGRGGAAAAAANAAASAGIVMIHGIRP